MLADYVTGNLGGSADVAEAAGVARVIVAGSSCFRSPDVPPAPGHRKPDAKAAAEQHKERAAPVRELDLLLTRLAAAVPVDVMPGSGDPTNTFLPQQPFHACLLPSAGTYSTFRAATNPYAAALGKPAGAGVEAEAGLLVVGTSGQNVEDVMRYSSLTRFAAFLLDRPICLLPDTNHTHIPPPPSSCLSCR
jgi:DNA polymerase delta subunit 2